MFTTSSAEGGVGLLDAPMNASISTTAAMSRCFLVTFVGGFGAGFAFPQWGHIFAPYATVPPHAGQLVMDRFGSAVLGSMI
jgi:hypothetical protein